MRSDGGTIMAMAKRGVRIWLVCAFVLATVRIGAFAFVEYRERTGTQALTSLPLVLLLLPEGLVLAPRSHPILFAGLLGFGSTILTFLALVLFNAIQFIIRIRIPDDKSAL